MEQRRYSGIEFVRAASELARRIRAMHPTAGLFEVADLQWWWRSVRSTDDIEQVVWFDDDGSPVATTVATDWGDRVSFAPMVLPDTPADLLAQVIASGLADLAAHGIASVDAEVRRSDSTTAGLLGERGFTVTDDGVVEAWLDTRRLPAPSPLLDGYRLASRAETTVLVPARTHHMAARGGPGIESRLHDTDLYRADLDLVVIGPEGDDAGYGLFWVDPVTATGLVEPMRTEDAHQRRGLARHVLTVGVARLAAAGATRVKICFEPGNDAAAALYLDVGFVPDARTDTWSGPTH